MILLYNFCIRSHTIFLHNVLFAFITLIYEYLPIWISYMQFSSYTSSQNFPIQFFTSLHHFSCDFPILWISLIFSIYFLRMIFHIISLQGRFCYVYNFSKLFSGLVFRYDIPKNMISWYAFSTWFSCEISSYNLHNDFHIYLWFWRIICV